MPRALRIEYEDAIYHVMARGNQRRNIVFDDDDRRLFVDTFAEACGQTEWRVYAWVLMSNHYHFVLRTPKANLVSGMTWFQNAFTRRMNAKNKLWGRLFGDRYKAVLVDPENNAVAGPASKAVHQVGYLPTLIDYVHLNPARARIVCPATRPDDSLLDYSWSSLAQAYARPPSKRADWMASAEGLEILGERDTSRGRRRYVEGLDDRARQETSRKLGIVDFEGQTLHSTLQRGWYWGSQGFREKLVDRFGAMMQSKGKTNRTVRSSRQLRDCAESVASEILASGKEALGLSDEMIGEPNRLRGDWRRSAIAWAIWTKTSGVSQQWIAEALNLRTAANVSNQVRNFAKLEAKELPVEICKWIKSMER